MRVQYHLNDNVDHARADAAQEIINIESPLSPCALHVAPKHPQHEHVDEDVPDALMQKKIGKRLPDETVNCVSGNQSEPHQPEIPSSRAKKHARQFLKKKNGRAG